MQQQLLAGGRSSRCGDQWPQFVADILYELGEAGVRGVIAATDVDTSSDLCKKSQRPIRAVTIAN
jgi:hypothetical protein